MSLNIIALGGNAILDQDPSDNGQKEVIKGAVKLIVDFIERDEEVVICHGNGPQVGNLLLQQKAQETEKNPGLNLDTCVAMTQGSIGYWLQNAFQTEFKKRGSNKTAVAMITQTLVSQSDPSFSQPTKPVGPFYTEFEAKLEAEKDGALYLEDAGRGYRKVVPSPLPQGILEKEAIGALITSGIVPICGGGGGIPVIEEKDSYQGVEAVNDKDFTASIIAQTLDAQRLIILTGVDAIFINYNQPNQERLEKVSISEAEKYVADGQFAAGSMLPKVEAAIEFVKSGDKREAIITSINNLANLSAGAGTVICS